MKDKDLLKESLKRYKKENYIVQPWTEYPALTVVRKIEYKLKKLKSRIITEKIIKDGFCKILIG